jgi:hypothetical protein
MPDANRVAAFVALVESGAFVAAIEQFYTPDATMQENQQRPRRGRVTLIEHEQGVVASAAAVSARHIGPVLIAGDTVVINWLFEFTLKDGRIARLDELAHQTWSGDRIASERFYYDPRQMDGG